jgi:hypothetical protein
MRLRPVGQLHTTVLSGHVCSDAHCVLSLSATAVASNWTQCTAYSLMTVYAIPFGHPAAFATWPDLTSCEQVDCRSHLNVRSIDVGCPIQKLTLLQRLRSAALQLKQPQQLLSAISHISTGVLLWLIYHKGMYQKGLEF